jgi:hypothetical protein
MTTPLKIAVFIDSCAWNELFSDNVDLAEVFPQERYSLFVTREVEIELLAIPTTGKDGTYNRRLKAYIAESIATHSVRTTSVFGFASVEPDGSLSKVQVYGGFGQGTWQSDTDRRWYGSDQVRSLVDNKGMRTTGLAKNQADASLAVRSFDSIVLTNEGKENSGPLRLAAEQGGRVVYLADVKASRFSLKDYIAQLESC